MHFSDGRIIVHTYYVLRQEISFQFRKCKYYFHQCNFSIFQSFSVYRIVFIVCEGSHLSIEVWRRLYLFVFCFFLPLSPFFIIIISLFFSSLISPINYCIMSSGQANITLLVYLFFNFFFANTRSQWYIPEAIFLKLELFFHLGTYT